MQQISELILHPATLVDTLMSSGSFLAASLGSSVYTVMSTADSDRLTSFSSLDSYSFFLLSDCRS